MAASDQKRRSRRADEQCSDPVDDCPVRALYRTVRPGVFSKGAGVRDARVGKQVVDAMVDEFLAAVAAQAAHTVRKGRFEVRN